MPGYLVETYVPRAATDGGQQAARAVRTAADELSREGTPVRYVRTTVLPDDETCFHFLDAACAEDVVELSRRVGLLRARIVPAFEARA